VRARELMAANKILLIDKLDTEMQICLETLIFTCSVYFKWAVMEKAKLRLWC
jgi:hypothetical protein